MTSKTGKKIIQATLALIQEKGFKATTTRMIAERAGVNEVTLFRHFGNKKGIVEAAVVQESETSFDKLQEKLEGHLERDLMTLGESILNYLFDKKDQISIALKEPSIFLGVMDQIVSNRERLKKIITDYFTDMKNRQQITDINCDVQAEIFLLMIMGYFLNMIKFGEQVTAIDRSTFLQHSVTTFIQGIGR
ncbi:TetR family transcriptional regulator [Scopulibacillus darangshiensis]|uniref:TetR family transcriptional regulator n=1 Tax=Scopulibacillus darangshiensis TaxID=442528 RepID=A0A4R2NDL6_9BACL|nr:TetR/AcrR family transcriptional regulator [Scopulibacillus darangshiensis]TCP19303.1 TetR family transcriptional regulator [Scopulibacillus darangshiensis]